MNCKSLAVWRRFARIQLLPWLTLIQASYEAVQGCPHDQTRFLISISKLNLLSLYEILEDLIRYPPY